MPRGPLIFLIILLAALLPVWKVERIKVLCLAGSLLRHLRANTFPKVSELRHVAAGNVVRHRHTRQLDDPALNRIADIASPRFAGDFVK